MWVRKLWGFEKVGKEKERQKFVFGPLTRQSCESRAGLGYERIPHDCAQTEPPGGGPRGYWRFMILFGRGSGCGSRRRIT